MSSSLALIAPSNAAVVQAAWHLIKKGLKFGKLALKTLLGCSSSQATSTAAVPSTSAPELEVAPAPAPSPAPAPAPTPAPAPAAELVPELVLATEGPAALQQEEAVSVEDIQKMILKLKVSSKKKVQLQAVILEALQTFKDTSDDEEPEKISSFSFSSLWGTARRVWDNVTWAVGVACTIVSWVMFLTQLASQLAVILGAFYAYYKAAHIVHLILLHL